MITICSVPAQVQPCSTDRSSRTQCHFYISLHFTPPLLCSVPAQVQPCSTDRSSHTQCHFYTFAYPPSLFCSVPTQVQPCSISHTSCTQYHFYICLHSPPPCSALFPHRFSPVALVRPPTLAASTLQTSLLCSFIWRSKRGGQMPQLQALKRRRKGTAV